MEPVEIVVAILLLLAGLVVGYIVGYFSKADPPAPYMELIPKVEEVANKLPASDGDERKRLCREFKQFVDDLVKRGAPKSIVDAGRDDLKKYCPE